MTKDCNRKDNLCPPARCDEDQPLNRDEREELKTVESENLTPYPKAETIDTEAFESSQEETQETVSNANPEETKGSKQENKTVWLEILDYIRLTVIMLVVGLLLVRYVVAGNIVEGRSMFPTLKDQDRIIVEKVTRYVGLINRGDILTIDTKGLDPMPTHIIKRVVALPGETVEIRDQHVFVNGTQLEEPYLEDSIPTEGRVEEFTHVTLGADEYFCLGDNREVSKDSRTIGPIPRKNIDGKLLVRFYPFSSFGRP